MDLLPPLSAFTVFLAICAVGFLFLVMALVFGGIFDFLETDHDFDTGGPGFFSSRVMAVFVTAFGGFGAVATYYGLASGPGLARRVRQRHSCSAARSTRWPASSTTSRRAPTSAPAISSAQIGRVVVGIPPGGVGQVRVRLGEELMDKIARTRDGDGDRREHVRADRRSARRNRHRQEDLKARSLMTENVQLASLILVDSRRRPVVVRRRLPVQPQLHQGLAQRGRGAERTQAQAA